MKNLVQSIYLSTAILALLFVSACGDSGNNNDGVSAQKIAAANLDGTYKFTSSSCTVGKTTASADEVATSMSGAATITIQGTSMSLSILRSVACTETELVTITDLSNNSMNTTEGAETCSGICTSDQCVPEAASNKKDSSTFTLVGGALTVTDSVHDDSICADPKGMFVQVWSK